MSRDTPPPRSVELSNANQLLAVDSGWSTVPPAPARVIGDETAGPIEESGVQRLAARRRADGTLLGVAPPQPSAPIRSYERRPVVVQAGVAPLQTAPSSPRVPPARIGEGVAVLAAPPQQHDELPPAASLPPQLPLVEPSRIAPAFDPTGLAPAPPPTPDIDIDIRTEPLSRPTPPTLTTVAQPEAALPGLGDVLRSRVRFAGAGRPLWGIVAMLALLAAGIGAAFVATWRPRVGPPLESPAMAASHLPTPALPPASPPAGPDIPALQAKTAGAGTIGEVLKLASVAAESQRREAQLFRERLSRDPSAWRDRAALAELRKLVADPNTAPAALAAAAELPGPAGADILYEIWTATPNRTATTELARALLHSQDVRAKASEALSIALELRVAETCAANRELLPRAQQVGDRRAFSVLSKLSRRQGCGPNKQQDCYACLRDGMELEEATKATKARRAPSPFTPP